ncbi:DUF397 domain-containing protein [Streptomyces sp. NPDC127084]|uniref:DUF397 domain-containing protein n=1 Tax=Streptomyces sp. NPDC127084 TaxID=3347133 RepID=UPI00364D1731
MHQHHLTEACWRKSGYSDDNGGDCLEILEGIPGVIPVRDSKMPDGPVLAVPAAAWSAFVAGAVTGG